MTLSCILAFHIGNRGQALALLEWLAELGPQPGRFFLMCRQELQDPSILPTGWEWMTDWDQLEGDWSAGGKDATGANSMWQQAAREARRLQLGPWLWLEPDAVPCRVDWMAMLAKEYEAANKCFMGAKRNTRHAQMSGVGVYHQDTAAMVPNALMARQVPFDQYAAADFVKNAHFTALIVDEWRSGGEFTSKALFDGRVPKHTALYHACKDGTIYDFLRARIFRKESEISSAGVPVEIAESVRESLDDFYKSPAPTLLSTDTGQAEPESLSDAKIRVWKEWYEKTAAGAVPETFLSGTRSRLDWIMEKVGTDPGKRQLLYAELKKRGIECGRKKRRVTA